MESSYLLLSHPIVAQASHITIVLKLTLLILLILLQPAEEIKPGNEKFGKYLPLNEAVLTETLFYVGLGVEFRAEHTGQLICFANDAHTLYWNNRGKFGCGIYRESGLLLYIGGVLFHVELCIR